MSHSLKRRTVIFIVRVWAEYLSEQPLRWQGVIEMAGTGQKIHFSHLEEIAEIIQKHTKLLMDKETNNET